MIPPSCPKPKFPVNARARHTYMQIGKDFSNWIKDRIGKFQFFKNVNYSVYSPNLTSKECGVESNGRGSHNAKEYWLANTTARMMAADVNSARGVEVIKILATRHERLEALEKEDFPVDIDFANAQRGRVAVELDTVNHGLSVFMQDRRGMDSRHSGIPARSRGEGCRPADRPRSRVPNWWRRKSGRFHHPRPPTVSGADDLAVRQFSPLRHGIVGPRAVAGVDGGLRVVTRPGSMVRVGEGKRGDEKRDEVAHGLDFPRFSESLNSSAAAWIHERPDVRRWIYPTTIFDSR